MSHCSLCLNHCLNTDPKPALIFLDIDGVLIDPSKPSTSAKIHATLKEKFSKKPGSHLYSSLTLRAATAYHFDPDAIKNLEDLIERIQKVRPVRIILSSSWREDGTLAEIRENMFANCSFADIIVGKTPSYDAEFKNGHRETDYNLSLHNRVGQIKYWLLDHQMGECPFVIFDDEDNNISEYFPNHFVHVKNGHFLSKANINSALQILKIY